MSHFDDVEIPIVMAPVGILALVIVAACIIWAASADNESERDCAAHGETYIDSRTGYTLCEQDGGSVVRR